MSRKADSIDVNLEDLQRESFDYVLQETNLANGMVIDRTDSPGWPASIAAIGFALAAYPVGVERGFIARDTAVDRALTTLRFFWNSPQGPEPDATGYRGFYYHFLDMQTGRRACQSELSTIDTSLLLAGVLTAGLYFSANNEKEQEIGRLAKALFERVDWNWAQNYGETVTHGWRPENGFIPFRWEGYDEALLLYIFGLGSPTHPLPEESYLKWSATYRWVSYCGYEYVYAGPLFTHQFSHLWVDFRGIQDAYMRQKGIDYFENSRRATFVQQRYAIENPMKFAGYGPHCWGLTASDGPGPDLRKVHGIERKFFDYFARGAPYGPDDGTIAPWAVVASLPFAPEIVIPTVNDFIHRARLKDEGPYGFKATFNPSYPPEHSHHLGWISPWHYGINLGPIVLMIENYRTNLLWQLMRHCSYIINGLKRAGFTGGWL